MKKLTKIVLGAVLSVAMVVTGGLAALTMNKAQASSLSIAGHDVMSTVSPGATIEYGAYKQVTSGKEFTGVKLEGKSSAIFRLGSIDLAKSNWDGTYTTLTGKGNSFIEFVFNPSAAVSAGEIKYLSIELTQGNKTVTVKVVPTQYDSGYLADELLIRAVANGQTKVVPKTTSVEGAFRNNYDTFTKDVRKGYIYKDHMNILFGSGHTYATYETGARGNAVVPLQLFYNHVEDANGNVTQSAVYTTTMYKGGSPTTNGLGNSFLVRDFVSAEAKPNNSDVWATPFKKNADGTMPVDVVVKFGGVDASVTTSSIVITKLGDLDLSKTGAIKDDGNVVGGIETVSGSASVGEYSYTSVTASGTNDATLTETLNVRRGLKLTGSTGSVFNLGQIDISKSSWNGTVETITGAYNPFIEFVYHPTVAKLTQRQSELKQFTIKLTDATDSSNFFEILVRSENHDAGAGNKYQMMAFKTKGSTQSNFGAWRSGKGLVTEKYVAKETILNTVSNYQFGSNSSSSIRPNGLASYPAAFIYDNNTLFSNVTFATTSAQLSKSYAVRNFADTYNKVDTTWSGFKGNNVNVTITFDDATTETSIVLTSLGGNNFTGRTLGVDSQVKVPKGSTVTLNDLLYFETNNGIKLAYGESEFVKGYKVNGTEYNGSTVVVNGETTVEFLGEDGKTICSTTLVPSSVTVAPEFTNGGRYEIWNETTDVTDGGVAEPGYEIRMYPGKQTYTGLALKDVRKLLFNGVAYHYDTENKKNAELPFDFVDKGEDSYYSYTISTSDSVLFNPSIYFDNYCKITVTDPYKTYEPVYKWTNEQYTLPEAQLNYQAHYTGNSNDGKELFGYIRKDVGKNYETKQVVTRADGFTYAYGNDGLGQIYYQGNAIGKLDVTSADFNEARKVAYSVVPNMEFEAFYVDINTRFDMKFVMNADGTPNESLSGLRYVVEFNKEDWNKYMYYTGDQDKGESKAIFRTYITTESQYKAAGNDFSQIESAGTNWMTSNWNAEVGKKNKLNLQCLSVNGSKPITATAPGFIYYTFEANSVIWLDDKYNEKHSTHKAFAITINNLKSNNVTENYLFTTFMANSYVFGSTTGRISTVQQKTVKGLSEELFTKNVLVDSDSAKYDFVDQNGVSYSSEYTMEHVQWLANKAGKGLTFTKA